MLRVLMLVLLGGLLAGCGLTTAPLTPPATITRYQSDYLTVLLPGPTWQSGGRGEPLTTEVLYQNVPARLFFWSVQFPPPTQLPPIQADLRRAARTYATVRIGSDDPDLTDTTWGGYPAVRLDTPHTVPGLPPLRVVLYFVGTPTRIYTLGAGAAQNDWTTGGMTDVTAILANITLSP